MASRSAPASLVLLVSVFLLSGPLGPAEPVAQQVATIVSDLPEYFPGETVTLTGAGWTPGETVTIVLHRDPFLRADDLLTSIAAANGTITNTSFTPLPDDLGVTYFVTATGSQSGLQATGIFKAKKRTWTGAVSTDWNTAGNWNPSGVPEDKDDITIPAGVSSGRYPVVSSAPAFADSVVLEAGPGLQTSITVSGGSLSVGNLKVEGGTLNVSGGTLLVTADIDVSDGATVNVSGTGVIHLAKATGDLPTDSINLVQGATFNQSGGTVNTLNFNNPGNTNNPGGTYNQSGGTLRVYNNFKNTGSFVATAGTIEFAGSGSNDDAFDAPGTNQFFNVVVATGVNTQFDSAVDAQIRVRGNWTMNGTAELIGRNTRVTFNGSGAQTIGGTAQTTFRNLFVDKTAGSTVVLARAALVTDGDVIVVSGTLDLATFTLNRSALGGEIGVVGGAFLKIGGTNGFPVNYATHSFQPTSTVDYYGTNQTVTAETYGHLHLSTSGTKTMPATAMTIQGNFTMSGTASATAAQSLTVNSNFTLGSGTTFGAGASAFTHIVRGNFSNSGTFTSGPGTFTFNGTGVQTIGGSNSTTFNSLNINNPAGVFLNGVNTTVNGILSLTSGNVTTGPSLFIATSATANVSRTSGHVVGNFQKFVATGATTLTYEIGDSGAYTPVTVAFASVSAAGTLTGSTTPGDHPNAGASPVDRLRNVNRYWTFTNSGLSFTNYNATFNFVAGDLDAGVNTSAFIVGKFSGGSWTTPTVGSRTSGSTEITGVTSFGDFEIGEGGQGTTLGTGADPANTTVAPGGAATTADAFTFQTSGGTDTVTAVTVTLAPGTFASLLQLQITDDAGSTVYGSVNPLSDTPSIQLTTPITATTTSTQYKIRVRPENHGLMPVPPGSSYALTARVSSWTGSNVSHVGSDSGGTTVTIDNLSPANVLVSTATSGNTQVTLAWTNPLTSDLGTILVLRRAGSAVGDTPTEGATYAVGNSVGSSIVACVVTAPATGCTDTGLANGTVYHYKIFANDTNGNYATGAVPTGSPVTANVTTLGNGIDPANATVAPGGAATMADAFTFQTGGGTDAITAITVRLAPGTSAGVSLVEITSDAGSTDYGVISDPSSDILTIPLTTPITATTTSTQYKIRVTAKSHIAMPVPPGTAFALTASVSLWTGTNVPAGSDSGGTTITIDNLSPGDVTGGTATGGKGQIALAWTNPAASDLDSIVVLRRAGAPVATSPTEGVNYFDGDTIGSSIVACIATAPATTCTDEGLDNGTVYHYKIFARDGNRNYAIGVVPTGSPVTPTVTTLGDGTPVSSATIAPGGAATMADAFAFQTAGGTDAITAITVTLASGTSAAVSVVEITDIAGTIVYGSVSNPSSDTFTIALTTNIVATTTSAQYRIRVTPKSHAAMPAPPGTSYALTAHITDWSGSNAHDGVDSGNTIITIDNLSPGNVTNATATAASTQVLLAWTNPADSDLGTIVVLRQAGAVVSDTPAEGVTYSVGNIVGSSTVACVTAAALGCADVGLINGTDYHHKIFAKDANGNYATGVVPTGSPATPFSRITVTPTSGLTTTEAGGTATFIVVLSSRPVADVTIGLSSSDTTEGTVSPSSLTFTSANWDIPQTVTVTGVDDARDDGDVAYSIVTAPATSAGGYNGQDASDVSVTNTNNDTAGIKVQPTGLSTTEAGGTATFTVLLNTQPTADVTIGLSSSDTTEGTISLSSVTFTSANWSLQQTVTVTGVSDALADGNIPYTIVTAPAASSDGKYNGMDPIDVAVTNIDNNTAFIIVDPTSGLTTTEAGGTATFAVRLNTQPTADVTIGLSSSDTTEGTISLSSLTFTTSNWDTAQTVTVTGVDDDLDDGDVAYTIITAAATSSDGNYNGLNPSDASVTNIDNETSVITVTPTSGLTTTEAGGTATFTIVLTSQPTADVTIDLTSSNTEEGTVTPASVNVTPANWNVPQTVTVTGVDDPQADGNITYTIVTAPATSTDPNYSGRNVSDVSVTNLDNDAAGITVTPTSGLTTSEAGGTATFTVVLTSQPTADVTIGLSSNDLTEGTVSPASLTFTPANWNTAQTVTITGVNNPVADGDITYLIVTAPATSTDRDYSRLNASDVSVTNIDDDTAGIVVTPTSGLITSEIGGEAPTFTVVLTSQPTANVVIGLSSSDTTEGNVSPVSLTFTSANWNLPQTVTVHGVNDVVDDGDIVYSIVTAPATSGDPVYSGMNASDVSVTNVDSDVAGFFVTPVSGLTTTEAGGRAHFTVVLNTQPSADVTIPLSSSNPAEGTVSPASLTFTSDNWNIPQTVDVIGVNDALDDGDIGYTIVTAAAVSADPGYNGLNPFDVTVLNVDNDAAGITVSPAFGLTTTESGGTATFTIVLNSQPTADVTIALSSSNPSEGTVSLASVTFTAANWNTPRTVTVTGVDDLIDDGDTAYTIVTAAATSSDVAYSGLDALDVSASNTDNDTAGFTLTPTSGLITTEAGGTATFTVVLTARPTANVTMGLISADTTEGTVDQPSVTFTSDNWNTPQTVTITGVNDALDDGDIAYDIVTTPASSSDSSYNGLSTGNVSVTNTDNDAAGITVTPTFGLTTTEAGGTATFTVVLASQPTADVTIGLTSSDTTEGTVSPASLTFTTGNWNTPRTVTVTGVDDFADDGDISFFVITAPATSGDSNYNLLDAADVLVTNTDNDATGIAVTPTAGLTTTEAGGTATYTIVLTSQPAADVTIALSSTDTTEGTISQSSLTFTPANWNIPQTVTVTGVNDAVDDGDILYNISNAPATSADASYNGFDPIDVSVTNIDDDTSGITITPTSGLTTTEAGGTAAFTVVLTLQPTADVTLGLTSSRTAEGTVSPASLTFTPANWNVAQTVTVSGVDDAVDDGDVAYTIIVTPATSSDPNYSGLNASNVAVTNTDNDTAGVTVSPPTGLTTTEAGGTATLTIVLTTPPTGDVTIALRSSDTTEGTVSPATVTFTSGNWNVAQTATVTGVDDALDDGDIAFSIVLTLATSSDVTYAGLNAIVVGVTNTDNDGVGGVSEVLTGTYVGNGQDNRAITGLGFQPDLVIIKANVGLEAVARTSTMTGDVSKNMATGENLANAIQSLDASGFTVGNGLQSNFLFVTYQWVAWKKAPGEMVVGTYTGNGLNNRSITGLGFSPDIVFVLSGDADQPVHKERAGPAANAFTFEGVLSTNSIPTLGTDGFTVGNNVLVNRNGTTYHYVAWNEIAGKIDVGTYTGNDNDNRNIAGVGFQPDFLTVQTNNNLPPVAHSTAMGPATDASHFFNATANQANQIQVLQSAGFQVGSAPESNGNTRTFTWAAWGRAAPTAVRMATMTARRTETGVVLEWRTGYEADNLGFHVYRGPENGRVRLTTSLLAGSALQRSSDGATGASHAYRWSDETDGARAPDVEYWVEEIALSGERIWHGPLKPVTPVEKDGADAVGAASPSPGLVEQTRNRAAASKGQAAVASAATLAAGASPQQETTGTAVSLAQRASVAVRGPSRPAAIAALTSADALQVQWSIAAHAAVKIDIAARGWYRVTQPDLVAAGLPVPVDPSLLQLFVDGVEQPMQVNGGANGRFDSRDSVEFYATGADTPYTGTRTYWLVAGDAPGQRIPVVDGRQGGLAGPTSFPSTFELKPRSIFFGALENGDTENFFGPLIMPGESTNQVIDLPDLIAPAPAAAQLVVALQGVTDGDHRVGVRVNGVDVGEVTFAGRDTGVSTFAIAQALLVNGANTISLDARGGELDNSLVDSIRVTYHRRYRARANRLIFTVAAGQQVAVAGFSAAGIHVIDITGDAASQAVSGRVSAAGPGWTVTLAVPGTGPRTLLAVAEGAEASPVALRANVPSTLNQAGQAGDILMIAPAAFHAALAPLKAFREGQGYTVRLVDIEDVYDEFSFGGKTPYAIRDFMVRATGQWITPPRFLLLVGNATQDPRNYFGFGEPDYVPTKVVETGAIESASDDWFVDADDDGYADLALVGRLPARSAAQVAAMVAKIVGYEQGASGDWQRSVVLVSDRDPTGEVDFAALVERALEALPDADQVTEIRRDIDPDAGAALKARLSEGAGLVSYAGHGSVASWRLDLLTADDVPTLTNGSKLPIVIALACLNGMFDSLFPEESLAEALVRAPNGGAVGVWASSGVTSPQWQWRMNLELYRQIFQGGWRTIGEAMRAAKQVVGDPDVRRTWIYFGDPVTRFAGLPGPAPETTPATPGSQAPSGTAGPGGGDGTPATPAVQSGIRLADFDANGRADLFFADAQSATWLTTRGSRGVVSYAPGDHVAGEPMALDLDGDGRSDLFVYDARTGQWLQAMSLRDGRFSTAAGTWQAGLRISGGDFNGDGRDEVFGLRADTGAWFEAAADGRGGFTSRTGTGLQGGDVRVADFDGDARDDVFVYDAATGRWTLMLTTPKGPTFERGQWAAGWDVTVARLNTDRRADLFLWNGASGAWSGCIRNADAFACSSGTWAAGGRVQSLDRDGDGRDELLRYDARTGSWTTIEMNPAGKVSQADGLWEPGWSVASGDLDGDGRDDLVLYNAQTGEVIKRLWRGSKWKDDEPEVWPAHLLVVGRRP